MKIVIFYILLSIGGALIGLSSGGDMRNLIIGLIGVEIIYFTAVNM